MYNERTCCFSGHRIVPRHMHDDIKNRLSIVVDKMIDEGITDFISGGALGFDLMAAAEIIEKKRNGRNVRLLFALPCKDHSSHWGEASKRLFQRLCEEADEIIYVSEKYGTACMRRRNHYMVDRSAYCVCLLLHASSGTGQTALYAQREGLKVINIAHAPDTR